MNKRLDSIDCLRGIAALGVVLTHCKLSANFLPEQLRFWMMIPYSYGGTGVVLFIVLSGFCIHFAFAKNASKTSEKSVSWSKFWKRRFWRLYPTYVIAAVISVCVYYSIGASAYVEDDRIQNLFFDATTHLMMIHNLFKDYCQGLGNGAFWSLALEEQLYALYFVFLFLRSRFGIRSTLLISLAIGLIWSLGIRYYTGISTWGEAPGLGSSPLTLGRWMQWPFAWWFIWVLGAFSAELNLSGKKLPAYATSLYCILFFFALGILTSYGFFVEVLKIKEPVTASGLSEFFFGIAFFFLINNLVQKDLDGKFKSQFVNALSSLGKKSYSIYLIHLPVIFSTRYLMGPPNGPFMVFTSAAICFCGSILAGFVLFYLVERHFLRSK